MSELIQSDDAAAMEVDPPAPTAIEELGLFIHDAAERKWVSRGRCRYRHVDEFFAERGESTAHAKSFCRECEVVADCLEYALKHRILFGVWGGKSERERRAIRRQRRLAGEVGAT